MSVRVSADNFEAEVLNGDTAVIADFYSDSCVPCKRISPLLAEIEEELEGKVKVAKINVNFDAELAEKYEVMSVPTLVFFKNGKEITRTVGMVKKAEITDIINSIE